MQESLYIRVLGRVKGPFEWDKLRILVKRGQLSRIHEVSTDSQTWVKATEYPELFQADPMDLAPLASTTDQEPAATPGPVAAQPTAPSEPAANTPNAVQPLDNDDWYYDQNGSPAGPFKFPVLQQMVAAGQVPAQTRVWKEGMDDWAPAQTVAGLGVPQQPVAGGLGIQPNPQAYLDPQQQMAQQQQQMAQQQQQMAQQQMAQQNAYQQPNQFVTPEQRSQGGQKSRVTAALLALLIGGLGIHKFYLNQPVAGIFYILFVWTFIPALLSFIEGIIFLTMNDEDFAAKYG